MGQAGICGLRERTVEAFRGFVEAFGLHSPAMYKKLYRNDIAEDVRSALTRDRVRYDRIDWGTFLDIPPYVFSGEGGRAAVNVDTFATATALLNLFGDVKPFAHSILRGTDLGGRFGRRTCLDPHPLFNLEGHGGAGTALIRSLFPDDCLDRADELYRALSVGFLGVVCDIAREAPGGKGLLGRNTGSYFAILKHWTHHTLQELEGLSEPAGLIGPGNIQGYAQVMRKLIQQLYRRCSDITGGGEKRDILKGVLDRALLAYLRMCVLALLDGGYGRGAFRLAPRDAAALMADEAAETVRSRLDEIFERRLAGTEDLPHGLSAYRLVERALRREAGFHLRYRFYRPAFMGLGDLYGDCTAGRPSNQANAEVTNIHWTVCAWLMNPFYRVLEVCAEKDKGLIKAHLTPLVVEGRHVLMVDAIETVLALREEVRGARNREFDEAFFRENSEEPFLMLIDRCVELGRMMNAEAVYADLYSNATWIRRLLERRYPQDSYSIRNVYVPFDEDDVSENVRLIRENAGLGWSGEDVRMEIQAINPRLMEQGTARNYKIVAVLDGLRGDWALKLRGV